MSQPDFRRDVRTPISRRLLKREAARNLAHVIKIVSHYDTAARIFGNCCRNVSRNRHSVKGHACLSFASTNRSS
jgi:hypothetical protein